MQLTIAHLVISLIKICSLCLVYAVQVFPPNEKIENINDQYWTLRAEEVEISFFLLWVGLGKEEDSFHFIVFLLLFIQMTAAVAFCEYVMSNTYFPVSVEKLMFLFVYYFYRYQKKRKILVPMIV